MAFWGAVAGSAAAIWPGHSPLVLSATVPPGLVSIAGALGPVFLSNVEARASLSDAANAIASVLHLASLGGIAAVGPPSATFPIL